MTGAGSILGILAIGALVYFMLRKGGGCCGGSQDNPHESDNEQTKGGCCG